MASQRPFAIVRTADQWRRCAHARTALDETTACVELAADDSPVLPPALPDGERAGAPPPSPGPAGGIAFDRQCRAYHAVAATGRLESVLVQPGDPLRPAIARAAAQDFVRTSSPARLGDFTEVGGGAQPLAQPGGLAVDAGDHLFVAETGRNRVLVFDLGSGRPPYGIRLADESHAGPRPLDLAASGRRLFALTASPARVLLLGRSGVLGMRPLPAGAVAPTRLAVAPDGRIALLEPVARKVWFLDGGTPLDLPAHATDLEFESADVLVVAFAPGDDFRRIGRDGSTPIHSRLKAREYDGLGIARAPDGRIAFWTKGGLRQAVPARVVYEGQGTTTTFRLDSGDWQTVWGRLFLDACLPLGTDVRVHCATADEPPDGDALAWTPPANLPQPPPHAELSPPLPPLALLPLGDSDFHPLHRRDGGREIPWAPPAPERFVTLDAPILAGPGRFLWVTLKMTGNTRVTPRVSGLRAEYPTHDYLRRLPRVYSRDPDMASFLRRYLAPLEGTLGEIDGKGFERAALLDPEAAPAGALPWLASFLGLLLDERWARAPRPGGRRVDARRALVAEANCLFRFRGTVPGLKRYLELYAGVPITLLEQFRVRGLGGGLLGARGAVAAGAVVGAGLRVGGALGARDSTPLAGSVEDAYQTHAHRFSVIVPSVLDAEGLDVLRHVLEVHRPAHTLFEICTVGAGMRVGIGLHAAIVSFVGESSGFSDARLGELALGRGTLLGFPATGTPAGSARLDGESRVL